MKTIIDGAAIAAEVRADVAERQPGVEEDHRRADVTGEGVDGAGE